MKKWYKTFAGKLWCYFAGFASVIFLVLWLLQTVFLQNFYSNMAISHLTKTVSELAERKDEENFLYAVDEAAYQNSMLIFLLDREGNVLYNADEYSTLYQRKNHGAKRREEENSETGNEHGRANPYISDEEQLNWEKGALRKLPDSHKELLLQLFVSDEHAMGSTAEDGSAYIYGIKLDSCESFPSKEVILCVSIPLQEVSSTAHILRLQLAWVSALALLFAFVLAIFFSWKFERPIGSIAGQAKKMAQGDFSVTFEKGFCTELDDLADTLNETTASLERLENSRRELLANVSHDLRTPLTMIKGYAEIVQEISWSNETQREHDLMVIKREADRLTALVNEILEYSSMQAGGRHIEPEALDISKLAEEVIDQFAGLCQERGITIQKQIPADIQVQGDLRQLARVIYNFIDNAINHTGAEGRVQIDLEKRASQVRFTVHNDGENIAKEDLPYIWEKYYTSRNRKNPYTVSGLGLSISKEILQAHGAEYGVENGESNGDGSTFWFELKLL